MMSEWTKRGEGEEKDKRRRKIKEVYQAGWRGETHKCQTHLIYRKREWTKRG